MILNNKQLTEWGSRGGITPFNPAHVNPASIDLCWSGRIRTEETRGWSDVEIEEQYALVPGFCYMLDTMEYVEMPMDCCGLLLSKTKTGRGGSFLGHVGWVDPGFEGTLTFELYHPVMFNGMINAGQRIVQLVLLRMEQATTLLYSQVGHYHGQAEPTVSK